MLKAKTATAISTDASEQQTNSSRSPEWLQRGALNIGRNMKKLKPIINLYNLKR